MGKRGDADKYEVQVKNKRCPRTKSGTTEDQEIKDFLRVELFFGGLRRRIGTSDGWGCKKEKRAKP